MDVQKQIDYWKTGAEEDMGAAGILSEKQRFRHALFFAHLALEKALKAHVVIHTRSIPPRTHNLIKLSEIAGLSLPPDKAEFLNTFDAYQMQSRYPDILPVQPDRQQSAGKLAQAREVLTWLTDQFPG